MGKDIELMLEQARANDNEPIFVLRAKDLFSIHAVSVYLEDIETKMSDPHMLGEVAKILQEFIAWREQHSEQVRFPD